MSSSSFNKFFSVAIHHKYYDDAQIRDLVVTPDVATKNKMRAYSMLFRAQKGGFTVLIDENAQSKQDVYKNEISLVYSFSISNPNFENFSDLTLRTESNSVYYFSDINTGPGRNALTVSEDGTIGQADNIYLMPMLFMWQLPADAGENELKIVCFADNTVAQTIDKPAKKAIQIDLRNFLPGRYSIKAGDKILLDFYADTALFKQRPYGIIEIFNKYTVTSDQPLEFFITFGQRKTLWKYFIVNTEGQQQFEISDSSKQNTFNLVGSQVALGDGNTAEVFSSAEPIPLQQYPSQQFALQTQAVEDDIGSRTMIEVLPVADTNIIKPGSNGIYSEIYVYIENNINHT